MGENNAVQKKPSFIGKFKRFFRDVKGETKKIVWPDKPQIVNNTGIVIMVVVIAAIFVGCFDVITSQLIKFFLSVI